MQIFHNLLEIGYFSNIMVRYKKRYFVVQLDRESDLFNKLDNMKSNQQAKESSELSFGQASNKKKRKRSIINKTTTGFKRALIDPQPLHISDGVLVNTLKELVGEIHGDFGRAAVTTGK